MKDLVVQSDIANAVVTFMDFEGTTVLWGVDEAFGALKRLARRRFVGRRRMRMSGQCHELINKAYVSLMALFDADENARRKGYVAMILRWATRYDREGHVFLPDRFLTSYREGVTVPMWEVWKTRYKTFSPEDVPGSPQASSGSGTVRRKEGILVAKNMVVYPQVMRGMKGLKVRMRKERVVLNFFSFDPVKVALYVEKLLREKYPKFEQCAVSHRRMYGDEVVLRFELVDVLKKMAVTMRKDGETLEGYAAKQAKRILKELHSGKLDGDGWKTEITVYEHMMDRRLRKVDKGDA